MADTLFGKLWRNHPALQTRPLNEPCATDGKPNFENQLWCAVIFGVLATKATILIFGMV
jgi:hypothetical protein